MRKKAVSRKGSNRGFGVKKARQFLKGVFLADRKPLLMGGGVSVSEIFS